KLEGHTDWVRAVAFSRDGQLLASASYDQTVRLWNPATGEEVQQLKGHTVRVSAKAFSRNRQLLTSAANVLPVKQWNPATGEVVQKLELRTIVKDLNFSKDNRHLETDGGILLLHYNLPSIPSLKPRCARHFFLNADWITEKDRNLLWLPHGQRGCCS